MPMTYLDRYLSGEREAVWTELTALGPAIREQPLFADAQAVARETMTRARANVELLVQRLTALGYRFMGDVIGPPPAPYASPSAESLTALGDLEAQHGVLPLSIATWYEVVGAVDFTGIYPRLSAMSGLGTEGYVDMMIGGERIRVRSAFPFYVRNAPPSTESFDPDAGLTSDPLVVWPCIDALVDTLEEPSDQPGGEPRVQYFLGFAPDAITKANESGGDGPHIQFGDPRMDARSTATTGRASRSSPTCAPPSPGAAFRASVTPSTRRATSWRSSATGSSLCSVSRWESSRVTTRS